MPFNKVVTSDIFIRACIEAQGIFTRGNRSYDYLVAPGATSVRRPKLPKLVVKKNTGTAADSADRKGTKADTTMVETSLNTYAVPIKDEIAAQFESNKKLVNDFAQAAKTTLEREWDKDFIAAGMATTNIIQTAASGTLSWKDLIKISQKFRTLEVPRDGMIMVVSAALEDQLMDIDVIKNAASYNTQILSTGKLINVNGFEIFVSGLVPKTTVNNKDCVVGIHGPGLASIISNTGEIKEAWDGVNLQDNLDFVAHAGFELDGAEFAVVLELK